MRLGIAQILKEADSLPTRQSKIDFLREHSSNQLIDCLRFAYDPFLKVLLPPGKVPYKCDDTIDDMALFRESRRLYLFVEGGHPNLKQSKREGLFIQMMQYLNKEEGALLEAMKDRRLPYETITPDLVNEAFPGILSLELAAETKVEEAPPVKKGKDKK